MAPPPAVGMKAEMLEQASGSAHKLIEVQKSKTGAFTYMKPTFDSDRVFLLGGKQVRTIQPLPAQQAAAKQPEEDAVTKRMRELLKNNSSNLRRGESFMFSEQSGEGTLFMPNGSVERRQLQAGEEAEKLMRKRRPDIMGARDIQYSLELLGKLLPPQNQNNYQQNEPVSGPTLDQLMNQMNQNSKGFFGWMKKSLNINN